MGLIFDWVVYFLAIYIVQNLIRICYILWHYFFYCSTIFTDQARFSQHLYALFT